MHMNRFLLLHYHSQNSLSQDEVNGKATGQSHHFSDFIIYAHIIRYRKSNKKQSNIIFLTSPTLEAH